MKKIPLWVLDAAVAIIAVIAFVPAVGGPWLYDDHPLIRENPYCHSFAFWPRWFVTDFWNVQDEIVKFGSRLVYWRPAVTATYAFDWTVSGGSPVWFHVTNLAWHAAVGVLAAIVLRRWIGATVPALVAALLFVVHPTKAESVAWIAGRTDVLCMVAVFLASQGIAMRLAKKRGGLVLEALATLVAYMMKEQAIVLPVFAAVEAWVALGRGPIDKPAIRAMIRTALPQAAVAIVYFGARKLLMPIEVAGGTVTPPLGDHVLAVLESLGRFFALTFVPWPMSVQQGLVRIESGHAAHDMLYVVIGAIALVAVAAAAFAARRRMPFVTVGLGFFVITLLPTSNVMYTDMTTLISERFLYLPLLGMCLALGGLAVGRRWLTALLAACVAVLAVLSIVRSADYRDEAHFWQHELDLHPDSPEALKFAARHQIAERHYRAALEMILRRTSITAPRRDVTIAFDVAQVMAQLVPDHDRASLEAIDKFCADVLAGAPKAELAVGSVRYALSTTFSGFQSQLANERTKLLALRADLHARLGDDEGAVALARQDLEQCAMCVTTVSMAALTFARAGDYDDALALLDAARGHVPEESAGSLRAMIEKAHALAEQGRATPPGSPANLNARASELAALELWGRAYDVLAPHKEDIRHAPKFVIGFAELALRAGEAAVARDVLQGALPPAEIDEKIREWTRAMGWETT